MSIPTSSSTLILPDALKALLQSTDADPRPVVVITCGISGAGKSTLSKAITAAYPRFTRLSIDAIIHARHGLYGIDYAASAYDAYQREADEVYVAETTRLLDTRPPSNLVLDRTFYAKSDRDEYRAWAEKAGARLVLVYLRASREVLWRRITERREKGRDADSAFDVTEQVLDRYLAGFEAPSGEGEFIIQVT